MYELKKQGELLLLNKGGKEYIYSLKEYEFTTPTKGLGRVRIDDIDYGEDTKTYIEIIRQLSQKELFKRGLDKFKDFKWLEVLTNKGIRFNRITNRYATKRIQKLCLEGKNAQSILKTSKDMVEYLSLCCKDGTNLNTWEIEDMQQVGKCNPKYLIPLGITPSMCHLITPFNSEYWYTDMIHPSVGNCSLIEVVNNLLDWGYTLTSLENYIAKHTDLHIPTKISTLFLLHSYIHYNKRLGRKYDKYPKDLLIKASDIIICSFRDRLEDLYSEIYTDIYNTKNIFMPKTYDEYLEYAKKMKNCLLKEEQSYSEDIMYKRKIILFSEYNNLLTCLELRLVKGADDRVGQVLGIKNTNVGHEQYLRQELMEHLSNLDKI